jgi:hypothetical protein
LHTPQLGKLQQIIPEIQTLYSNRTNQLNQVDQTNLVSQGTNDVPSKTLNLLIV